MFFKSTLTVPKIKDLVHSPNKKYQHIYDTILHNSYSEGYTNIELLPNTDYSNDVIPSTGVLPSTNVIHSTGVLHSTNVIPNENFVNNSMKNELKSFLKKQLNGNTDSIMGLESNF
jgi:hypothetical protein